MWPFRKKNQESIDLSGDVPTEVKEYYQAEKRERAGVAWLLAAITFAVVVAVVLGLFFGGRAVIRHFRSNDNAVTTQTTDQQAEDTDSAAPQTASPAPSSAPSTDTTQNRQPAATTPAAPAAPAPTLHNTGPTGDD